jgi:DNA-binding transcriptional ArsR family regulator
MTAQSSTRNRDDRVFKALSGTERRLILDLLKQGPLTTGDICRELPKLNRCTVMQHLGVLESAELVISKKRGRSRWNFLDVSPIQRIYDRWIGEFASPSAQLLDRLKQDLESS